MGKDSKEPPRTLANDPKLRDEILKALAAGAQEMREGRCPSALQAFLIREGVLEDPEGDGKYTPRAVGGLTLHAVIQIAVANPNHFNALRAAAEPLTGQKLNLSGIDFNLPSTPRVREREPGSPVDLSEYRLEGMYLGDAEGLKGAKLPPAGLARMIKNLFSAQDASAGDLMNCTPPTTPRLSAAPPAPVKGR